MRNILIIFLFIGFLSNGQGIINSYSYAGGGVSNYYTTANAANPDSEVNATTGTSSMTTVTWASSATSPQNGSYMLEMTSGGASPGVCRGLIEITGLTIGVTYTVTAYVKEITGLSWEIYLNSADGWLATAAQNITANGVWVEYSLSAEADATTAYIRLYGTSSANNGDKMGIDNIRVTPS